ncbi:MAG: ABC transporter substrate-binding protein [Amnibacterium sp.]
MPDRPLPEDPRLAALIRHLSRTSTGRRQFLAAAGVGAATLALAACSPAGGAGTAGAGAGAGKPGLKPATDRSATDKSMVWANWSYYLDQDSKGKYPTLEAFQQQTGIKVTYDVAVDDNNTYYAKVKDQLALGQDIGADTVCLTDWMVSRLIGQGYLQRLDHAKIPNAKNLLTNLQHPVFDPNRDFSLPWQSGFAGLAWNKKKLPSGLHSVDELWDPKLKGRIGVLSEMRDTIGILMLSQGVDISSKSWGDKEFTAAIDLFKKQVDSGQIRNIKGNSYADDLKNEDTLAAIVWSGDITQINGEVGSDKFAFALPDTGGTLWSDNYIIPMGAKHKANAETLINYYYEPEVAAKVAAYVNYITPVQGAQEAMKKVDPSYVDNQLIFPDAATLAKAKIFRTLTNAEQQKYSAQFEAVGLGS